MHGTSPCVLYPGFDLIVNPGLLAPTARSVEVPKSYELYLASKYLGNPVTYPSSTPYPILFMLLTYHNLLDVVAFTSIAGHC